MKILNEMLLKILFFVWILVFFVAYIYIEYGLVLSDPYYAIGVKDLFLLVFLGLIWSLFTIFIMDTFLFHASLEELRLAMENIEPEEISHGFYIKQKFN
jgi:hypothetical protein